MKKLQTLLISLLFVGAATAAAQELPQEPHMLYGDISAEDASNQEALSSGTLTARANGQQIAALEFEDGSYGSAEIFGEPKLAIGDIGIGETVSFYVNGLRASETIEYSNGTTERQNLTVSVPGGGPVGFSNIVERTDSGTLNVEVPDVAPDRNTRVQSVSISTSESNSAEVNLTVSDEEFENSGVDESEMPEVDVEGYIKVDTTVDEDVEAATVDMSVSKDVIENPEAVTIYHFDDGELVEEIEPEYLEDRSDEADSYFYSFETESFSTFVATSDSEDPNAEIQDGDRTVEVGEDVLFDASESTDNNQIESYEWNFGDGEEDTGEVASHSYGSTGSFDVILTVTDEAGNEDSATVTVDVEEADTGGGGSFTTSDSDSSDDESSSEEDESQENQSNQQQPEDDTSQANPESNITDSESQNQETEQQPQQDNGQSSATGQFTASPTSIVAVVAVFAAVLLAGLEYTGRTDLISKISNYMAKKEEEAEAWNGFS